MTENVYYAENRKKRKKINWMNIILLVLFGCYLSMQIYLINANSIDTVKAGEGYINDSIITQGIVCREESVLVRGQGGVVDYLAENGERVSKGYHLADVYPSNSDLENIFLLRNRQSMLDDIVQAESYLTNSSVDMTTTKKELTGQLTGLAVLSDTENYSDVNEKLAELTLSLNKIGVATGRTTDFSAASAQLKSEIAATKEQISRPINSLYSSYTGYFMQTADGYENIATVDYFMNSSYEEGSNIINQVSVYYPDENSYGKIITDYKWNICLYLDKDQCDGLKEGKTIQISTNVGSNEFTKASVKSIIDKGSKNLVVIQCTTMTKQSASVRITDCEILFKQYTGIKIPKSAVRFDSDQNMGVFINFSNIVKFKKITPIYEDDNYMIVPIERSENNQLKLYDSIIVKGRNLYDGKYL
ncbi:MAG: hypothetical protein IKU54_06515 [Oscillospiraceae bacterium]|nr:hypothetical protein [Oscillospiraceae bacterium]